jgi:hypothetical protein
MGAGVSKNGVAHVSFAGGGVFVPAHEPYDRQVLIELVNDRVQAKGQVQVLVDDLRWMVFPSDGWLAVRCSHCGTALHSACYCSSNRRAVYCVACAFGGPRPSAEWHPQPERVARAV